MKRDLIYRYLVDISPGHEAKDHERIHQLLATKEAEKRFDEWWRGLDNIPGKPWFFGCLSMEQSDTLTLGLDGEEAGSFFVYFSSTSPGVLTMAYMKKDCPYARRIKCNTARILRSEMIACGVKEEKACLRPKNLEVSPFPMDEHLQGTISVLGIAKWRRRDIRDVLGLVGRYIWRMRKTSL